MGWLQLLHRSFHENMKAKMCVDGELLDEIEVENAWSSAGLYQGSHMVQPLCMCGGRELDVQDA